MKKIYVDLETYSPTDLSTCGVYRYTEDPEFKILLLGYSYDDQPPQIIDLDNGDSVPPGVAADLFDPSVLKLAHNAAFERTCFSKRFKKTCPPTEWRCTMVHSLYAGLPGKLSEVSRFTGLQPKVAAPRLIKKFCSPPKNVCNGSDWEAFKNYNLNDVLVERELARYLEEKFPMPDFEWMLWHIDQRINDRGFLVDLPFVRQAHAGAERIREQLLAEAQKLTGLSNPNSRAQLLRWLELPADTKLDKSARATMLANCTDSTIRRVLELRDMTALSSIGKYSAILRGVSADSRFRGAFRFYGAHTGRWSSTRFQAHNLPKATLQEPAVARQLVMAGAWDELAVTYSNPSMCLSLLLRSCITTNTFLQVTDFASIEARILAWLGNETWALDEFRGEGKIYEMTAAKMYGISKTQVTREQRQMGKTATLGCGYQGGPAALTRMGAAMTEEDKIKLIRDWRRANANIVKYWGQVNSAAISAVNFKAPVRVGPVTFAVRHGALLIILPSGREMIYQNAVIGVGKYGDPAVCYDGRFPSEQLYGGKITENIVQGIARDLLALHIIKCKDSIVAHIHDEVVLENDRQEIESPAWYDATLHKAESFETKFYRKG